MEQPPHIESNESREAEIDSRIEELAEHEGMAADDIQSDILTFMELLEGGDEDVQAYFEELAEKLTLPLEEMLAYASKKLQDAAE